MHEAVHHLTSDDDPGRAWTSARAGPAGPDKRLLSKAMMPIRFFSSAADAPAPGALPTSSCASVRSRRSRRPPFWRPTRRTPRRPRTSSGRSRASSDGSGRSSTSWPSPGWRRCWSPRSSGTGRRSLFRDQVLALFLAALGSLLLAGDVATAVDGLTPWDPPPIFPAVAVSLVAAVLVASSPHLGRPARRTGRLLVGASFLAAIALGGTLPMGAIAALAIGTAAGDHRAPDLRFTRRSAHRRAGVGGPRRPGIRHRRRRAGAAADPRRRRDARHHERRRDASREGLWAGRVGRAAPLHDLDLPVVPR